MLGTVVLHDVQAVSILAALMHMQMGKSPSACMQLCVVSNLRSLCIVHSVTTVVTETHREAVENLINLSSAQVFAKHAASFRSIAHAWQVVEFWIAKVHRAAKFGVFCCVLTPFRRFDTIWAD